MRKVSEIQYKLRSLGASFPLAFCYDRSGRLMTREFAARYATALLRGIGARDKFEVAFPEKLETQLVAQALCELGCAVEWAKYGHYIVVRPPEKVLAGATALESHPQLI